MAANRESATGAPAVADASGAGSRQAVTLGTATSIVILLLLLAVPLFVKNFIIFQLTTVLIYGIAVLALNILTGGSGQSKMTLMAPRF